MNENNLPDKYLNSAKALSPSLSDPPKRAHAASRGTGNRESGPFFPPQCEFHYVRCTGGSKLPLDSRKRYLMGHPLALGVKGLSMGEEWVHPLRFSRSKEINKSSSRHFVCCDVWGFSTIFYIGSIKIRILRIWFDYIMWIFWFGKLVKVVTLHIMYSCIQIYLNRYDRRWDFSYEKIIGLN